MKTLILIQAFFLIGIFSLSGQSKPESRYDFNSSMEIENSKQTYTLSPYAIFGDSTQTLMTKHEQNKDHTLKIPIIEEDNNIGLLELDMKTGIITLKNNEAEILFLKQLSNEDKARFTTMDPMAEKYYSISPYVYCLNNPLKYTDPQGDTVRVSSGGVNYDYRADDNGNYGFYDSNSNLYSGNDQFVSDLASALSSLNSQKTGANLISYLVGSTKTVSMVNNTANTADINRDRIMWNPNGMTGGVNTDGNENRSAFIGLGHEMAHIEDSWKGTIDTSPWVIVGSTTIPNAEKYATHIENQIRAEHGEPLRTHYGIQIDAGGNRLGLESTRIINRVNNTSSFYNQSNRTRGILLLPSPFKYK